jgi:hypothetical protein
MTSYPLPGEIRDDEQAERRRGMIWLWLAVIAVLVAGLITLIARLNGCQGDTCGVDAAGTASASGGSQSVQSTSPHGAGSAAVSIAVSGSERGSLAPGATRPIAVSIVNTGGKPARVTSANVSVGNPSKACTAAASIRVTRYDASLPGALTYDLAPGATVTIPLTISMRDLRTNQNACKNASFPLTFHATAQQG